MRRMSRSSVSIPLVATVLLGSGVLVGLNRIASKGITVTQSVYVTLGIGFGITIGVDLVALLPVTLGVSHLLGRHVERYRVFNSIAMLMLVLYLSFASTA